MNKLSQKRFDPVNECIAIYLDKEQGLILVDCPELTDGQFTLGDVYKKYESFESLIYVVYEGGLSGTIYRCNNYGKGIWQEYAKTQGYA